MTATPTPSVVDTDRPWAPHWSMARGLLAGCATGAALGALTMLAMVTAEGGWAPAQLVGVLVYTAFAAIVGAIAGTVCALVSTGLVLLVRATRPIGLAGARTLGAVGAAAPVALTSLASPSAALVPIALAAASAAAWMRWVVGLPRRPAPVTR